nr:protein lutein deficient 5, chloroplastic [Quercus suber]
MSSWKAKAFVLAVAIVPPTAALLDHLYGLQHLVKAQRYVSILAVGLYVLAVMKITVPFLTSPLRSLPYPPGGSFFLGNMGRAFFSTSTGRADLYRGWMENTPNAGLLHFRGFFHTLTCVLVTTTEGLQEVLLARPYDYEKTYLDRMILTFVLGHGLIASEGAEHKFQRKTATPAFAGSQINALVPLFWSKSRELVGAISEQLNVSESDQVTRGEDPRKLRTGVVELGQWASRVTLDIIGVACVGRDFNSLHNSDDEIAHLYENLLQADTLAKPVSLFFGMILPPWIARWVPVKRLRECSLGSQRLRTLFRGLMETKRRDMELQSEKHVDILSVLIRTGQFSDDGLVDQLLTFLAAG